jgi:hypothetical protein
MIEGKKRGKARYWLSYKFRPIIEITRKYRTPKIKMTKGVRFALLILRIYLIVMVAIIVFKFATTV